MRLVPDQPLGDRYAFRAPGESPASAQLDLLLDRVCSRLRSGELYSGQRQLEQLIDQVHIECAEADWDGEGSKPVTHEVASFAKEFVSKLPPRLPVPDVEAGNGGELVLEWRGGYRRVVLLSLYADRTIGYAVVRGVSRAYGREPFEGDVPNIVAAHLKAVLAP